MGTFTDMANKIYSLSNGLLMIGFIIWIIGEVGLWIKLDKKNLPKSENRILSLSTDVIGLIAIFCFVVKKLILIHITFILVFLRDISYCVLFDAKKSSETQSKMPVIRLMGSTLILCSIFIANMDSISQMM